MALATLTTLNNIFKNVKLKQTYGLSELGILPTKSESSNSLWFMLGGDQVEYKVVNNELFIRTFTATLGYLQRIDIKSSNILLENKEMSNILLPIIRSDLEIAANYSQEFTSELLLEIV